MGDVLVYYIIDCDFSGMNMFCLKDVLFFGIFDEEDIMRGMEMIYFFVVWVLWNCNMQLDSFLLYFCDEYFVDYFGNDFLELKLESFENFVLVKIDGNCQILMYIKGKKDVVVKIEDL